MIDWFFELLRWLKLRNTRDPLNRGSPVHEAFRICRVRGRAASLRVNCGRSNLFSMIDSTAWTRDLEVTWHTSFQCIKVPPLIFCTDCYIMDIYLLSFYFILVFMKTLWLVWFSKVLTWLKLKNTCEPSYNSRDTTHFVRIAI